MAQLVVDRLRAMDRIAHQYFLWSNVLADAGIREVQDLSDQLLLKCPFHPDKRPSFRIRLDQHYYHCFSCNKTGSVLDLMYQLSGSTLSKSRFYEQVLKAHPGMQRDLGFNSLFLDEKTLDSGFLQRRKFSPTSHIGSDMPIKTLSSRLQKINNSWETLVYSLSLLQSGESTDNIYQSFAALQQRAPVAKDQTVTSVSLASLLLEEEEPDLEATAVKSSVSQLLFEGDEDDQDF